MKKEIFWKIFSVVTVILILCAWYYNSRQSTGAWTEENRYQQWTDEVTIAAANGRDSTAVYPGDTRMTIAIMTGYGSGDTSFAASEESTECAIHIRGWSDINRTMALGQRALFTNFKGVHNPKAFWVASQIDSFIRTVDVLRDTIGVGSNANLWPYVDVLVKDTGTQAGKGNTYKIKYIGYSGNVAPD